MSDKAWPRWLNKKSAAAYSEIGWKRLITMAKDGLIVGYQDQDDKRKKWLFDRYSIDAYREAQAAQANDARKKARDILRSAGVL